MEHNHPPTTFLVSNCAYCETRGNILSNGPIKLHNTIHDSIQFHIDLAKRITCEQLHGPKTRYMDPIASDDGAQAGQNPAHK